MVVSKKHLRINKTTALFFSIVCYFTFYPQSFYNKPIFITPGISIGYTFGAKINYGFSLDVGIIDKQTNLTNKYGLSFYQYFVKTNKHTHRLRSFSIMYQNDYLNIKLGRGRAKNPWGFTNRNKCIVHGFCFDISASYPSIYSPWIGYRLFKFPLADWAWFMKPYNSVYINYKYDIIQNTELKNTITLEK